MALDIHNYKKRLDRTLNNVRQSDISQKNKDLLEAFHNFCFTDGLGICKIERYLYDAFRLAQIMNCDLADATKEDLQAAVATIEKKEWSPHTKHTFKVMIKKLYRYIEGIDEKGVYPEKIRWLRTGVKNNHKKLPDELMSEEEVKLMIGSANTLRDRALLSILYESGCRIGEIGSMRMKDITFDEHGARVTVSGKTGARRIRIVQSAPYVQEWVNRHKNNGIPDSYIWTKPNGEPLTYTRIAAILKSCALKAGIKKRVYPHLFRHSRATYLAKHLTEAQMKDYLGWTQSSKMAGVYVHLSGRDTDNAILKLSGVEVQEEEKKQELLPQKCVRCKTVNEVTNKFCKTCGMILNEQEANKKIKNELERVQADDIMNALLKDKEILKLIKQKISV